MRIGNGVTTDGMLAALPLFYGGKASYVKR